MAKHRCLPAATFTFLVFLASIISIAFAKPGDALTLWYDQPSEKWTDALPIGNGRLAAMVYGGPLREHLQLNEDTLTSGEPPADLRSLDITKNYDHVIALINAELNYWPAETTNLSELHEPFFRLIRETAANGTRTARDMYHRRGWVAHHNTSLWRDSYPVDGTATAAFWNMAAGWFSSHLWEHWLFTGDRSFLAD
jgi:hypothetical protein